jgi:hypothetical protein
MTSTANAAANLLPDVLSAIVNSRGPRILEDRRRLLGLLRDKAPGESRGTRILMSAFDEGIPSRLNRETVSEIDIGREASHLTSEVGIAPELARDAVLAWARALTGYESAPVSSGDGSLNAPQLVQPVPPQLPPVQPLPTQATSVQPLPIPTQPVSVQPLPPQSSSQPASVPPLPAQVAMIQPLPSEPASVQPLPAQPASVQPLPVQPLPLQSSPPQASAQPAAAAAAKPWMNKWNVLRIIFGVIIMMGGFTKLYDVFVSSSTGPSTEQQQAPAQPSTASPQVTQTPEGLSVLSKQAPFASFQIARVNNDPNSITFNFGVPIGNQAVSYQMIAVFNKTQTHGQGLIAAFRNQQTASSGAIGADRLVSDKKQTYVAVHGLMTTNPIGAPGICVLVTIAPTQGRIDLSDSSEAMVFGVDAKGDCDTDAVYGYGMLK